jgi:hypothetical protein
MRTRNVSKFRPSFETLEGRLTPAGNVTAVFTAATATLTLTGDALANGVDISAGAGGIGSFGVTGLAVGTATTVNSTAGTKTFNGVKNIVVNLGNGSDILLFGTVTAGTIIVQGNLTVNMGTGNDVILTAGGGNFLDVFGNLGVTFGAGNPVAVLTDVNVVGSATINQTTGGNAVIQVLTSGAIDNSFKNLTVTLGTGNDVVQVSDTNFSSNVTINTGASGLVNGGTVVQILAQNSANLLKIGGSLSVTTTSGGNVFQVQDYSVGGNMSLNAGPGQDVIQYDVGSNTGQSPTVKGNASFVAGGGSVVQLGLSGVAAVINGGLSINTSSGSQSLGSVVQIQSLAAVGNTSLTGGISITTGGGADVVQIDPAGTGSNFNGAVKINTGGGNDVLQIDGGGTSQTNFFSTVNADEGAGNDTLTLGNTGPVAFFKTATFTGGSAANDVNNTIVEIFANTVAGPVVPTLTHYHP